MSIAAIMAVSAMSISAFAATDVATTDNNYSANAIDYSVYDSDMVYIQEHADMVAEYNANLNKIRTSYSEWKWSYGVYSETSRNSSSIINDCYFVPTTTGIYFNVDVDGVSKTPYLAVNKLMTNGSLSYVGSYNITSTGNNSYKWENYKRTVSAGQKYVFWLMADTNWSYASIDIYKSAM